LNWNNAARGSVVDPLLVVGAVPSPFSVFTHVIVCATAEKSRTRTCTSCPSTALVVVIVIVRVAAELLVTVLIREVIGTVAAFPEAVMALFVVTICENVCVPVNVCTASVRAIVADVEGNVIVVLSVPARVSVLEAVNVFPSATASVEDVAGAVIAILLTLVAVATPSTGVTSVGVVSKTILPVPVAPVDVTPSTVICPVEPTENFEAPPRMR